MPVVPTKQIIDSAFARRYGVAAIIIFNDLTLDAVLQAATELKAPVIIQTSVKTVKWYGARVLHSMFRAMAEKVSVPVTLHLDHCPDRGVISECLAVGWNSVLFDAHELSVKENERQTIEVVAEAHGYGAAVEDDIGSDDQSAEQPLDVALEFIARTGIDCFAPSIGNKHGQYKTAPKLNSARITELVRSRPIPMALHGGSGLSQAQFDDLIQRGCAKVNISTALKVSFIEANRAFLEGNPDNYDPPSLFRSVREACKHTAMDHMLSLHSDGKAA